MLFSKNKKFFVVGLVSAIALLSTSIALIAGPCYRRTGGNVLCTSQPCSGYVNALDTLGCPGIYYLGSNANATTITWPCYNPQGQYSVPKHGGTSGNHPTGFQEQDYYVFPCRWQMACNRSVVNLFPLTVVCGGTQETCNYKSIFTAWGEVCREAQDQDLDKPLIYIE